MNTQQEPTLKQDIILFVTDSRILSRRKNAQRRWNYSRRFAPEVESDMV